MKMKFKTKKTLVKVLSIFACGLLVFGAVFGAIALTKSIKNETKKITPTFTVGGLDAAGKYTETKVSIYTKDAFACKGLEIKLDFDSNVKYQVFYYDDKNTFVSQTDIYTATEDLVVPADATHARLVVTPIWEDDVEAEDRVCHWYNTHKYSKQLEIRVLKNQDIRENLVENMTLSEGGYKRAFGDTMAASAIATTGYKTTSNPVNISDIDEIEIKVAAGGECSYIFYDVDGNSLTSSEKTVGASDKATAKMVAVPEGAVYAHFNFSLANGTTIGDYQILAG